jgi:hypothetical protein
MSIIGTPAARRVAVGASSMVRSIVTCGAMNSAGITGTVTAAVAAARRPPRRTAAVLSEITVHSLALFRVIDRAMGTRLFGKCGRGEPV